MEDRGDTDGQNLFRDKVRSPHPSSEAMLTGPVVSVALAIVALRLVGKTVRAVLNIQS
jgi:hypothetical protein